MGGLLRFLLGGVLGAVLGFFLSRLRGGTAARRPAYTAGDQTPAESPVVVPTVPVPVVAEPDATAEPGIPAAAPSITEMTSAAGWLSAEEELGEESYPAFEWGAEDDSVPEVGWAADELGEAPEETPVEAPVAVEPEPAVAEELCPPPAAVAQVPLAVPPVGEGTGRPLISAEELRARIEESRRRIRLELEEPFVMPARVTDVPSAPVVSSGVPAIPVIVPPRVPEPLSSLIPPEAIAGSDAVAESWEKPSPAIEIQSVDESLFAELGVRIDRAPIPGGESDDLRSRMESARQESEGVFRPSPAELETSLSYDAMRARIEETRNRLKAKAVDARTPGGAFEADGAQGPASFSDAADTEADIAARIDSILSERNE